MTDDDDARHERIDRMLADVDAALDDADLERARRLVDEAKAKFGRDDVDVLIAEAVVTGESDGPEAAHRALERLVAKHPDSGEGWHRLGLAREELGDREGMIQAFLRARELDAEADTEAGLDDPALLAWIEEIARDVVNELPEPFASKLAGVPITLEPRPREAIVREGFDPRAYGLFEGNEHDGNAPMPTCITLFTHNLLADFEDEVALEEQVEVTILHEVGHYFGLDEDDMERLGLD